MSMNFPSPAAPGTIFAPPGGPVYQYNNPTWDVVEGGSTLISGARSLLNWIDPALHAAIVDGTSTANVTIQCQEAFASGENIYVPRGCYNVSDRLDMVNNRTVYGDGRTSCYFRVRSDCNMAALGIIDMGLGISYCEVRDIGIYFDQPDTAVRASLYPYPPAIYAFSNPRIRIENIRIGNARIGIDAQGNTGGAYLRNVEIGAYDYATRWANSLDAVILDHVHVWIHGTPTASMTANQIAIYNDATNVGHQVTAVDDFRITGGIVWGIAKPLDLQGSFGNITNFNADGSKGPITISGGNWAMSDVHFSLGANSSGGCFNITGGRLVLNGLHGVHGSTTSLDPAITVGGGVSLATLIMSGGVVAMGSANNKSIYCKTNSEFNITGMRFDKVAGQTYSQPVIDIEGGSGNFSDNTFTPYTGGNEHLATAIRATTPSRVSGLLRNDMSGWQIITNAAIDNSTANSAHANRNLLVNGAFQVWQRGTTFTAHPSNTYFADRWRSISTTAATVTITRQDFTPGQIDVPGSPTSYVRMENFTGSQIIQFAQFIPDVRTAAGRRVTVKFWARSNVDGAGGAHILRQNFGSGGSTQVSLAQRTFTFTTSWAQYSYSRTLPSISGMTVGTESYLSWEFFTGALAANTQIEFAMVQLEIGDVCGPFVQPLYVDELNRCLPFFERKAVGAAGQVLASGFNVTATIARLYLDYQPKRKLPTLASSGAFTVGGSATQAVTSFTIVAALSFMRLQANVASGLTIDAASVLNSSDLAAYLDINAEV